MMNRDSVINQIEIYKFNIPFAKPYRIALGWINSAENILIRIHTNDGLYGVGEGSPISYICGETQDTSVSIAVKLAQIMVGKDSTAIEARLREMNAFITHHSTVKSAFDMALYDLMGKRAGMPLFALFGGEKRPIQTDWTVGIDSPERMAQAALEIIDGGVKAIKLKLGTGFAEDVARVLSVRQAIGPAIPLRIDANQGWSPVEAVEILNAISPFSVQYCEQPVQAWNEAGLRRIRDISPIPIVADESLFDPRDAFRLASTSSCDFMNIKLAKSGGLHDALMINAIAESAGMRCMVGSMNETRLALTAASHLASARPNIAFADLDTHLFHAEDPIENGSTYHGGTITLPDLPGLGADVNPEYLSRLDVLRITNDH
jgi:L-alanine-DL-glutamate epimerase-like enolase superfamily enzyme